MKRALLLLLPACSWSTFDDLANTTWVHSQEKPNIGSSDYATAIVGASISGADRLAVVSNDKPTLTTLQFDTKGNTTVGNNQVSLGQDFIQSLGEQPILVTDGMGKIALAEQSIDAGQIAVVSGDADAPVGQAFPSGSPPGAAVFDGATLWIGAGSNLFQVGTPTQICPIQDNQTPTAMPVQIAAMASDGTTIWVWTKAGALFGYDKTLLACQDIAISPPPGAKSPNRSGFVAEAGFMVGTGAQIHIVGGHFGALVAHADRATASKIYIVDLMTNMEVGQPLSPDGIHSSTVGTFGTSTYLVLGFPNRAVDSTVAGQVEIHGLDPATGMLDAMPAELLNDAQPEVNELFGRTVTTMSFNSKQILVVGGAKEVFAYYETQLYADARSP